MYKTKHDEIKVKLLTDGLSMRHFTDAVYGLRVYSVTWVSSDFERHEHGL